VFVSGLSNEQRRDEKNRLLRKTLELTFRREKDKYGVWQEYFPMSKEWVYRPNTPTREKEGRRRTPAHKAAAPGLGRKLQTSPH